MSYKDITYYIYHNFTDGHLKNYFSLFYFNIYILTFFFVHKILLPYKKNTSILRLWKKYTVIIILVVDAEYGQNIIWLSTQFLSVPFPLLENEWVLINIRLYITKEFPMVKIRVILFKQYLH